MTDQPSDTPRTEAGRHEYSPQALANALLDKPMTLRAGLVHSMLSFLLAAPHSDAEQEGCNRIIREVRAAIEVEASTTPPAPEPSGALPSDALDWARQLVEQGYRDEHIVTFTEDGYGLEHPIRCRPNLTGCILNEWLRTQMAPDREPGRYVMEWADSGPRYTLSDQSSEEGA